jgi:shikimate dehydrogenase
MAIKFHLAGVMGHPVMHSRSPLMHGYWFEQQGIKGAYLPLDIAPNNLKAALRALPVLGFQGCNLTIPHKQAALKIVDVCDDVARKIGAISCVVVQSDGTLFGTNNDWLGFLGNLNQEFPHWQKEINSAVVIGAGGGARAICYALIQAGIGAITVVNRTEKTAQKLAKDLGHPITVQNWDHRHAILALADLVVNTTNQGMVGQPALDLKISHLNPNAIVADIIYTPLLSPLLVAAAQRGNRTINGLGMLLHQGIPAWEKWFGRSPTVDETLVSVMKKDLLR